MNGIKTLQQRISETLYPRSSDNVVLDPPSDTQEAQQLDKHASHSQCLETEFGQVCFAHPSVQKPFHPVVFEGIRGVEAVDHLSTKFGDVKLEDPETLRSVQTEFGEVNIVRTPSSDRATTPEAAAQQRPDRTNQDVPATPTNTKQNGMISNQQSQEYQQGQQSQQYRQQDQQSQQDREPIKPTISSATKEVRGSAATQAQTGSRKFQPICSSKFFTTIVDQPCEKEIIEVIREHRFYEKKFVAETRPAGERELTEGQIEEELGTHTVTGKVTPASSPCEKAPKLVVHNR